ncbi:hypothetical protein Hbl1158_00750 [Halobaculum sp. CBA1158]|uniref:hypothetical protein n=1 Tax=Halobaculum sp. CBA1158 TaxID=2904243 RepID=UPI001F283D82|nr:hypothetical protein [Halobaculum sp. CBA1158]UIO99936.1 hypothetical protein Hbl1158_00750 [Halobaculum sp. CBA1158]
MDRRTALRATATAAAVAVSGCLSGDGSDGDPTRTRRPGDGDTTDSANGGDEGDPGGPIGSSNPYMAVVRENVAALNREDLDAYRRTLHPDAPEYEAAIDQAREAWGEYDLEYELEEVTVVERPETSGDEPGTDDGGFGDGTDDGAFSAIRPLQVQEDDCQDKSLFRPLQVQDGCGCEEQSELRPLQVQEDDCEEPPEARVRFIQVTTAEGDGEFRDNRTEGVHVLREYEGNWRIWGTEATDVEYL